MSSGGSVPIDSPGRADWHQGRRAGAPRGGEHWPRKRTGGRRGLIAGGAIVAAWVVVALAAPLIAASGAGLPVGPPLDGPGSRFTFQTDPLGSRRIFAGGMCAARRALLAGREMSDRARDRHGAGAGIGIAQRGRATRGCELLDALQAFPVLVLALALVAAVGRISWGDHRRNRASSTCRGPASRAQSGWCRCTKSLHRGSSCRRQRGMADPCAPHHAQPDRPCRGPGHQQRRACRDRDRVAQLPLGRTGATATKSGSGDARADYEGCRAASDDLFAQAAGPTLVLRYVLLGEGLPGILEVDDADVTGQPVTPLLSLEELSPCSSGPGGAGRASTASTWQWPGAKFSSLRPE